MPIEEVSLIDISLYLNIDDGSQILLKVGDDLRGQALYSCVFYPVIDVIGRLNSQCPTSALPILRSIKALAHVLDLDVINERWEGRLGELLLDEGLALLSVKLGGLLLHILIL